MHPHFCAYFAWNMHLCADMHASAFGEPYFYDGSRETYTSRNLLFSVNLAKPRFFTKRDTLKI